MNGTYLKVLARPLAVASCLLKIVFFRADGFIIRAKATNRTNGFFVRAGFGSAAAGRIQICKTQQSMQAIRFHGERSHLATHHDNGPRTATLAVIGKFKTVHPAQHHPPLVVAR